MKFSFAEVFGCDIVVFKQIYFCYVLQNYVYSADRNYFLGVVESIYGGGIDHQTFWEFGLNKFLQFEAK